MIYMLFFSYLIIGNMEDIRYLKGKIYAVLNEKEGKAYVGSTTEPLSVRFSKHRHDCKKYSHRTSLYRHIDNNNWADWKMTLLEAYPCNNRKALEAREYQLMNNFNDLEIVNKKRRE